MENEPKTILVIEDDKDTLTFLKESFKDAGYRMAGAECGEVGLQLFKDAKPDLVILDVMLPGMDGWEVLRKIKAGLRSRHVPVIMLTAQDDDTHKLKGYETGADFYIPKPFNMQKLLLVVRNMIMERSRT